VDDTNEKRAIGRLWEQRSAGNGLSIVVELDIDGKNMWAQLMEKLTP
jgi:type III restriction enzyme